LAGQCLVITFNISDRLKHENQFFPPKVESKSQRLSTAEEY